MKTSVGKVLSVVTAVASVIFLGFVLIAMLGGPNWGAEAATVEDYSFALSDGNPRTWSATSHVGQVNIPSNKAIEPVLLAVYDAKLKVARDEEAALKQLEGPLEAAITESQAAIEKDNVALTALKTELQALLKATEAQALTTADQVEAKAEEVRKVELQITSRREDVERLQAQVEEIRTDRFRINAVQQQIQDLIQQIDGSIDRAESRRKQLEQ